MVRTEVQAKKYITLVISHVRSHLYDRVKEVKSRSDKERGNTVMKRPRNQTDPLRLKQAERHEQKKKKMRMNRNNNILFPPSVICMTMYSRSNTFQ